jgi:PAS domain S-box-containing protein
MVAHLSKYWFTEHDLMCVETIGHLITTTIARNRAEQALTEQLRFDAALLNTVEAVVVALDADSRILNINRACTDLAGFSLAELRQRPLCGVLVAPEDTAATQAILARLESDSPPAQFECMILTKHGARRRIAWAFTRVPGAEQGSLALMGAGVDVTEKWEMENRMQRARAERAAEPELAESGHAEQHSSAAPADDADDSTSVAKKSDRRIRQRRAYPYMQRMAAIANGRMPGLNEFREVECNDIGAGGFSYFTSTRPVETDIVVAFGSGAAQTYLTARLVHVTAKINRGDRVFLVGCRYTGRHTYTR